MASTIKVKRSAVQGKAPTTGNLETGELALNTRDGRLYSKGTQVFEVGANTHSLFVGAGGATFANGAYTFPTADGSVNQFLQTDGSGAVTFASATVSDISDLTATATELNYVDGVTSAIQTQIDGKASLSGATFTGAISGTDLTVSGNATFDTNTLYVDSTNNRVGIGTTSPAYQFEIENTGANALLVLDRTDGAACFIEGQSTRSAFGSVGATPLALAYNSAAVVTIGAVSYTHLRAHET